MPRSRRQVSRDPTLWHPKLRGRWAQLAGRLLREGIYSIVWEGFRYDERQRWLYGQGRTPAQLTAKGLDPALAHPGPIVTNAWTAEYSAHGWRLADGTEAAAALDVVPLGEDRRPWTPDDRWVDFVDLVARVSPEVGLRHFAKPGKPVWDKPHVQMLEWNDATHLLDL